MAARKKSKGKQSKRSKASKKRSKATKHRKTTKKRPKAAKKRGGAKRSSDAETRRLALAYSKAWADADLSKLDALTSDRVALRSPPPGFTPDKQGILDSARLMHEAFPDQEIKLDHVIASKDQAACHFTISGTHTGDFMGLPPTGRRVQIEGVSIVKVRDGKVVEDITEIDAMGLMDQLGAPSPLDNAPHAAGGQQQATTESSSVAEEYAELWGAPYRP